MSKAFTKEDDDSRPNPRLRLPSALPPGAKNYVTPDGLTRLRGELDRLVNEERPLSAASAAAGDLAAKERLQTLDERILYLRRSLESAVVVHPPAEEVDRVRFGASVTVRQEDRDEPLCYRIVGIDETETERGSISYLSPIARALLGGKLGDRVVVRLPSGERELEIVSIAYQ